MAISYFEDIKVSLARDLEIKRLFLNAWKSITYNTKKDGTPFANMQKNINGATYQLSGSIAQDGQFELVVYVQGSVEVGYQHDTIYCYDYANNLTDEQKAKTENHIKRTYGDYIYKFGLEDIKTAIEKRIAYTEKRISELERELENTDKVYNDFHNALVGAFKVLNDGCEIDGENKKYSNLKTYLLEFELGVDFIRGHLNV